MAMITRKNPEGISKPFSNYSHVVTAEGAQKLVFCAGQVGADVDGKVLPPDDFDAQAKMVMANLTKALAAGGAKIADVTKITIFICNPHDVPKARGILQTYFAGAAPASTLCILRGLANPNFLLEIEAIAAGKQDRQNNLLKNAPHTAQQIACDKWDRPYSREQAAFPAPWTRDQKFWPAVARIDNVYGDRNLFCSCPPIEESGEN